MRRGVTAYSSRFIPSLGVLNDGDGPANRFVPPESLRRNLGIARTAGASGVWLFGISGLNAAYLQAVREDLPLEPLPSR